MKVTSNAETTTMPAYVRVVPDTFDEKKKYPVFIFLHGIGESGDETGGSDGLGKLERRLTEKSMLKGLSDAVDKYDFIAYLPQADNAPQSYWTNNEYGRLRDFVDKQPFVDTERIALGGYSMGAIGTLSVLYGGSDAAILRNSCYIPICGGYKTDDANNIKLAGTIQRLKLAVWAFQGDKDTVDKGNVYTLVKGIWDRIKSAAGSENANLSRWPDKAHDIWDDVVSGVKPTAGFTDSVEDVYQWMLRQKKGQPQGFKIVADIPPVTGDTTTDEPITDDSQDITVLVNAGGMTVKYPDKPEEVYPVPEGDRTKGVFIRIDMHHKEIRLTNDLDKSDDPVVKISF